MSTGLMSVPICATKYFRNMQTFLYRCLIEIVEKNRISGVITGTRVPQNEANPHLSYSSCFPPCQGEKGDPGLMGLPGARGPIGPRV